MPQLDVTTFFSQIFWVSLTFGTLYLINREFSIPIFASILKTRLKKVFKDLEKANIFSSENGLALGGINGVFAFISFSSNKRIIYLEKNILSWKEISYFKYLEKFLLESFSFLRILESKFFVKRGHSLVKFYYYLFWKTSF